MKPQCDAGTVSCSSGKNQSGGIRSMICERRGYSVASHAPVVTFIYTKAGELHSSQFLLPNWTDYIP